MNLDSITLSVIQAGHQQDCDEMDLSYSRAAYSPVIAEANDRSDGIYAAADGALIAQGAGGLPVFVGTMQYSTAELIRLIGEGRPHLQNQMTFTLSMIPILAERISWMYALFAPIIVGGTVVLAVQHRPLA